MHVFQLLSGIKEKLDKKINKVIIYVLFYLLKAKKYYYYFLIVLFLPDFKFLKNAR